MISSTFSFKNREEFYHRIRLNGAAGNKYIVAFFTVTVQDSCYSGGRSRTSEDTRFRTSLGDQMVDFEAVNLGKMPSLQPSEKPVVPPTLRGPVPHDQYALTNRK